MIRPVIAAMDHRIMNVKLAQLQFKYTIMKVHVGLTVLKIIIGMLLIQHAVYVILNVSFVMMEHH